MNMTSVKSPHIAKYAANAFELAASTIHVFEALKFSVDLFYCEGGGCVHV
jgi:hypothetical protein